MQKERRRYFFVRPPVNLFKPAFGVNYYTDEFGYPSTEKDWTAEPLVKQLAFEKTKNKETSNGLTIEGFPADKDISFTATDTTIKVLIIDMQTVFNAANPGKDKEQ